MNMPIKQKPLRRDTVVARVIEVIQKMNLQPGDRLISEKEFAARLGVNHLTLRSAYSELAGQGILERRPFCGTFIKSTVKIDPNAQLLTSRRNAVALVLRKDQHFFADIANAISSELHNRAYMPTLLSYTEVINPDDMVRLDGMREMGVGNIIFDTTILTENISMPTEQFLRGFDNAVGVLGCCFPGGISAVSGDYGVAYTEAVRYLHGKGHRKIMFCGGPTDPEHCCGHGNAVLAGHFAKAMIESGLGEHMRIKHFSAVGDYDCVADVLSGAERPTAIFFDMDYRAVKIFELARDMGLRVPDDISMVGFYDTPWAEHYGLSTFRFDSSSIAKKAIDLIDKPPERPEIKLVPVEFVERGSVRDVSK